LVEAKLEFDGRTYFLKSDRSSTTAGFGDRMATFREAIEGAIESIAVQAKTAFPTTPANGANSPKPNTSERMRELMKLREDGLLAEDEFLAKRKVLLDAL
jgi:hypothetical protein